MSAPRHVALAGLLSIVGAMSRAQAPQGSPTPKAPPPLRLAFTSLVPEAVFEIPGSRDFAAGDDAVWVLNREAGALSRIDTGTNTITQTIPVGTGLCGGLAADFGAVLIPQCAKGTIARVDAKTSAVIEPIATDLSGAARSFATGVGSVWVISDESGAIARIDPAEKTVVALIDTPPGAVAIAFGGDALWVASAVGNLVTRVNPFNNVIVETIAVPNHPGDIATGGGAVWTFNQGDGSVSRIDPKTNTLTTTIKIDAPMGADARIAFGEGSVWVAGASVPLVRIDPRTNRVIQIFEGMGSPSLAIAHGSLWLAASAKSVWRLDPRRVEATR